MAGKAKNRELKPWQEKVSERIARALANIQGKWACWMGHRVNAMSPFGQKIALLVFCMVMAMLSICPFADWEEQNRELKTESGLRTPVIPERSTDRAYLLPGTSRKRILQFGRYRDSLQRTASGRRILDSLSKSRPGLMDSLSQIEAYYQLQLKDQ